MENKQTKPRKKVCTKCGRKLWLRDFYKSGKTGKREIYCSQCRRTAANERYARTRKMPDGIFLNHSREQFMEHKGRSTRIHWSGNMISILKRYFPVTRTEEVASMIGVSPRTVIRKARELGLVKDPSFMYSVCTGNQVLAWVASVRSRRAKAQAGVETA